MAQHRKIRVGIVFGGRSGEHEVSLASAASVMAHLDSEKYEAVPIGITKEGSWLLGTNPQNLLSAEQHLGSGGTSDESSENSPEAQTKAVTLTGDPRLRRLIPVQEGVHLGSQGAIDVIFPVMHGTYGEDGALQGLLEMANVPYVGCGVLGSALGMDKEKMKMLFASVGLPVVDYLAYRRSEWERKPEDMLDAVEQRRPPFGLRESQAILDLFESMRHRRHEFGPVAELHQKHIGGQHFHHRADLAPAQSGFGPIFE